MDEYNLKEYLEETQIIDYSNKNIKDLAYDLSKNCDCDEKIAKNVFLYVRDNIMHVGDYKLNINTCKASDVLNIKAGWCYSKSHLVAALLRANNIPTALSYQRLSCSEYTKDSYCLHGLNEIYLKNYGWYKVDARGNKKGVNAQFNPPNEQLAFDFSEENEYNLKERFINPHKKIVDFLNKKFDSYENMMKNLPDYDKSV